MTTQGPTPTTTQSPVWLFSQPHVQGPVAPRGSSSFIRPTVPFPEPTTPQTPSSQDSDALKNPQPQQGKETRTSRWENWLKDKPRHHPGVKLKTFLRSITDRAWKFMAICVLITVVTIGCSVGLAYGLEVKDIKDPIPFNGTQPQILLAMSLVEVDPIIGVIILDWYPYSRCPPPPAPAAASTSTSTSPSTATSTSTTSAPTSTSTVTPPSTPTLYCIYFDPNLSATPNPNKDDPTNTAIADNQVNPKATFCFNPDESCKPSFNTSFSTFRTTSKLSGKITDDDHSKASLQAYPFDLYNAQISMFANLNNSGEILPVGMRVAKTWGVVVDFKVRVDFESYYFSDRERGLYFFLDVRRSGALKTFVMFIILTNWLVTIVFLWITIACAAWDEEVVKEIFVIPVSVLFAFTAVRSSMPGSPAGFGAFIDFVGILPNLAILTVCSCILLMVVIHRRIRNHNPDSAEDKVKTA